MADANSLQAQFVRLQAEIQRERAVSNVLRGLTRSEGLSDAVLTCVRGATDALRVPLGCGSLFMRSPVDGSVVEASSHSALSFYVAELESEKRLATVAAVEAAAQAAAEAFDDAGEAVDDRPSPSPDDGVDDDVACISASDAIGCGDGGSSVASTADGGGGTARSTSGPGASASGGLKRGGSFLVGGAKAGPRSIAAGSAVGGGVGAGLGIASSGSSRLRQLVFHDLRTGTRSALMSDGTSTAAGAGVGSATSASTSVGGEAGEGPAARGTGTGTGTGSPRVVRASSAFAGSQQGLPAQVESANAPAASTARPPLPPLPFTVAAVPEQSESGSDEEQDASPVAAGANRAGQAGMGAAAGASATALEAEVHLPAHVHPLVANAVRGVLRSGRAMLLDASGRDVTAAAAAAAGSSFSSAGAIAHGDAAVVVAVPVFAPRMLPQLQQDGDDASSAPDAADACPADGSAGYGDGTGSEPRRRSSSAAAASDDALGLRPDEDGASHAPLRAAHAAARSMALVGALVVRHPSAAAAAAADTPSAHGASSGASSIALFDSDHAAALRVIANALAASLDRALQVRAAAAAERRAAGLVALVKAVASERDTPSIIARLAGVAYDLLSADRVSVFLVDRENEQLIVALSEDAAGLRLPLSAGIAGRVATSGQPLNIRDAYAFPLFNRAFDIRTGYKTTSVLCVPCRDPEGSVTAVIQAINKMPPEGPALSLPAPPAPAPPAAGAGASGQLAETAAAAVGSQPATSSPQPFSDEDAAVLALVADTAGVAIHKAALLEAALAARRATEALGDAVRIVHDCAADDLETVMARLTDVAHRLVDADRVTLFLLDEPSQELFCQITVDAAAAAAADAASSAADVSTGSSGSSGAAGDSDSASTGSGAGGAGARSGRTVLRVHRVPVGRGVAGIVAASGNSANVPDCYADVRWDAGVEELPGYRSKTALFMPVRLQPAGAPASAAKTVAVIQAVNKRPGSGSGGVCLVPGGGAIPAAAAASSGAGGRLSRASVGSGRGSHAPAVTAVPFSRDDEAVLAAFASEISGLLDRRALQLAFHRARLMEAAAASGGGGGGGDGSGTGAGGSGGGSAASGMMSFLTQFARTDGAPGAGAMGSSVGGHGASGAYAGGQHGAGAAAGAAGAGAGAGGAASGHSRVKSSTGSRDPPVPMSRRGSVVGGPPLLSSVGPASHHSSHSSLHGASSGVHSGSSNSGGLSTGAGAVAAQTPQHSGRSSGGASSSAHGSNAGTARRGSSTGGKGGVSGAGSLLSAAAEAAAAAVQAAAAAGGGVGGGGATQRGSISAPDGGASSSASSGTSASGSATVSVSGSAESSPAHGAGSSPVAGSGSSDSTSAAGAGAGSGTGAAGGAGSGSGAAADANTSAQQQQEEQLDERILRPWLSCQPRPGRSDAAARVQTWDFDVLAIPEAELVSCTADMLQHFGLLERFDIAPAAALAFLQDVRRSYRRNPYHNYRHGVSVMHVAFLAMARSFAAAVVFSPLERLATLLAALCHDADHTGFNNAYEANSLSSLGEWTAPLRGTSQSISCLHSSSQAGCFVPRAHGRLPISFFVLHRLPSLPCFLCFCLSVCLLVCSPHVQRSERPGDAPRRHYVPVAALAGAAAAPKAAVCASLCCGRCQHCSIAGCFTHRRCVQFTCCRPNWRCWRVRRGRGGRDRDGCQRAGLAACRVHRLPQAGDCGHPRNRCAALLHTYISTDLSSRLD